MNAFPADMKPGCSVCGEPIKARGLCQKHYRQLYKYIVGGTIDPEKDGESD